MNQEDLRMMAQETAQLTIDDIVAKTHRIGGDPIAALRHIIVSSQITISLAEEAIREIEKSNARKG